MNVRQILTTKRHYSKKFVFSGIQPTGSLHIGNYLGAIKNWTKLQHEQKYEKKIFCIVDLHATTMSHSPKKLSQETIELTSTLLACGLDPKKCLLYKQSDVSGHAELAWILSCITPKNWLNQMTQFKDKSKKSSAASLGLYNYPVLMAADILLYSHKNEIDVPVGDDQKQHLELTRDITKRFNDLFQSDFFSIPNAVYTSTGNRIMNIKDGKSKMSKSDEFDFSRINLTDSDEQIEKKILKSKTDSIDNISFDIENRPELSNLINIYSSFENISNQEVCLRFKDKNIPNFKRDLIQVLIKNISTIRPEIERLLKERNYVENILSDGSKEANEIATNTLGNVKKVFGYQ
jgi:tryptophanyl-tRNA synthetase